MSLATFTQRRDLGEIVIDGPPLTDSATQPCHLRWPLGPR
jgi:hypothetical protein